MNDREMQARADEAAKRTQRWLDENGAVFVCDFCAHPIKGDFATYTLDRPIVQTMSIIGHDLSTGTVGIVDSEAWAACLKCDPVVAAGDALALARFIVANRNVERVPVEPGDETFYVAHLAELYREFYVRNPTRTEAHR